MLFADSEVGFAAMVMSIVGSAVAVASLFINKRFDGKFLVMEAAQKRCEEDSIKKDTEIMELRHEILAVHERGNVAALDRNAMRSELDTVKTTVARHDSQVLPVEEVKKVLTDTTVAEKLAEKVVEKIEKKKGGA